MKCLETTVVSGIPVGYRNWFIPQWHTSCIKQTWDRNTRHMRGYQLCLPIISKKRRAQLLFLESACFAFAALTTALLDQ